MARDARIQLLKGIGAIAVLLLHTITSHQHPDTTVWLAYLAATVRWCVLLFLFCAGVLHGRQWIKRPTPFLDFARRRSVRLMVPYLVASIVYGSIWYVLVSRGLYRPAQPRPPDWLGNIWAMQFSHLYFLPMLLAVSVGIHGGLCLGGKSAIRVIAIAGLGAGLALFPTGPFTGMHVPVFVWGVSVYAIGILCEGHMAAMRFPSCRWLQAIGEASGTIYLYHWPFVLNPILLVIGGLSIGAVTDFFGALLGAALTAFLLTGAHYALKDTRLRWLLL